MTGTITANAVIAGSGTYNSQTSHRKADTNYQSTIYKWESGAGYRFFVLCKTRTITYIKEQENNKAN